MKNNKLLISVVNYCDPEPWWFTKGPKHLDTNVSANKEIK
jgi:hypothetical protein